MKHLIPLLFLSLALHAQLREVAHNSILLPEGVQEDLDLIPYEEDVLLVNYQTDPYGRDRKISFYKFNGNLEVIWNPIAPLPRFYEPIGQVVSGRSLYHLSHDKGSKKFHLLDFDLFTHKVTAHSFESLTSLDKIGFSVFKGMPIVYGWYNDKPVIEIHDLEAKTGKVLPQVYQKNTELRGLFFNSMRDEIYVLTSSSTTCIVSLGTYDANGKLLYRKILGDKKHKLQDFDFTLGSDGTPYLAGTYNSYCAPLAEGFFFGSLEEPLHFKSLISFSKYTENLPSRQVRRLEMKRDKGKKIDIRQKTLFRANGFVSTLEFYQALSSSAQIQNYQGGSMTVSENKVNQLMVLEWDQDGNVVQEDVFKIESDPFIRFEPQSALLFTKDQFVPFLPYKRGLSYLIDGKKEFHLLFSPEEPWKVDDGDFSVQTLDFKSLLVYGVAESRPFEAGSQQIYFIKKLQW
ncbi:hypothetical protein Lbys_0645 [Leadbetterella byssophila DSM 17132]|uniref:Uncharacterized protein n=1 Tax=Leadbetterella byssophila (strain DSM 17132 / JCM 16389 / KACC 11308 / NBRC 106382 / 4M15) TaxID=649349 RepID=E4RYP5_LEAB4|nr:hypothetical protein [Leadbetterella byssophila]ADQ16407.1 hypothetical protein Lbys_0645 [Leadbetterella byssophila DSM 17132]